MTIATLWDVAQQNGFTLVILLSVLGIVSLVELIFPLHARGRWHRAHLVPNLALTGITLATNLVLNTALVILVLYLYKHEIGLLHVSGMTSLARDIVAFIALDFSFYVCHIAMHKVPVFWRYHQVHHCDPVLDATTTVRQHPGESLIRYTFLTVATIVLGPSLYAFAAYRAWSAINGFFEHANIRTPQWLAVSLTLLTSWPSMHRIHHSCVAAQTDTNYGNIFSIFDRLFGTFTPIREAAAVVVGLDGYYDPAAQTTCSLLKMPYSYVNGHPVHVSLPEGAAAKL